MPLRSTNPATGALLREFEETTDSEVKERLELAAAAQKQWAATSIQARAAILSETARILESERNALALLMTLEMGKPIAAARDEVSKCAGALRFYAANGDDFLADHPVPLDVDETAMIAYEPLGVILAIMPWNFPFWQVIRFAAPALIAGNGAILKHASNVPQCALAVEDVFLRAGLPRGVFQSFLISASRVEQVIASDRIAAVTLTGSEAAGREVAATAGRHLKKTVLELGGSDPFIVLASADVPNAAASAAKARTVNSGQSCIAAKRFIVEEPVARQFEREFVARMGELRVGDPVRDDTEIGPLATAQVLADVERQVAETVRRGAFVATGGRKLDGPGLFYPPTVLLNVDHESPVCTEEVFGPVAPVIRARDAESAIRLANDTQFGLGASVWTSDAAQAQHFAAALQCGMVFVNAVVHSDARLPFGGVKRSGYGRELGKTGIREFVNVKTIRVRGEPAKR